MTYFNPLPPHGGRQTKAWASLDEATFQSTPSAWRETLFQPFHVLRPVISIHSLRMEGDLVRTGRRYHRQEISIHSLRMEGDLMPVEPGSNRDIFQSTPSAWRETMPVQNYPQDFVISIHSLRMEGDKKARQIHASPFAFQSTPSAWRETRSRGRTRLRLPSFQSTPSAWRETLPTPL